MIVIFWCIRPTDYIRVFFVTLSMNSNILRDKISPRFGALVETHWTTDHRGAEEELAVEWSLGMICTLVYYTASSTGRDDCEYATRQTIGHWKALRAHVLSIFLQNKRFRV